MITDDQLQMEPVLSPVLAAEAILVNGWRVRNVVEQLVAKLGEVEAKECNSAVELRDTKERLVMAETKVATLLEVPEPIRDCVSARLAPRRQELARRSERAEREENED